MGRRRNGYSVGPISDLFFGLDKVWGTATKDGGGD